MSPDGADGRGPWVRCRSSSEEQDGVYRLFCELMDLSPSFRSERLAKLTCIDTPLATEVEGLLRAADRSGELLCDLDRFFSSEGASEFALEGDSLIGREVLHYRILERLGSGGMGVVYRGRDTRLDRVVALKFLPYHKRWGEGARARLLREARAASALDHPNIATVHDVLETPEGRGCIVMAHYEGSTLKELLARGPLDLSWVCDIGGQVACGLEAAHGRDIVHCDIKPENILITDDGVVKILDFGLARFVDHTRPPRAPLLGTLPYMAPEQVRAEAVSPRTDVWALGAILYEMATGSRPFEAGDPEGVARAILSLEPSPPSRARSEIPHWLEDVILGALRKDPSQRSAGAGDIRKALEKGAASSSLLEGRERTGGDRRPVRIGALLAVGVTITALATLVFVLVPSLVARGPNIPRFGNPRQLTFAEGAEDFASWSPSAEALVYQGLDRGEIFLGEPDILLRELDAEAPLNLTADHEGADGQPSWSPDGCCVAFYSDREGGGYFIQNLEDGTIRKLTGVRWTVYVHNRPIWSPDGSRIAVTADGGANGATLEIRSVQDGTLLRTLPLPGRAGNMVFGTTLSPDGRLLAVTDAMNITPDEAKLWVVRMEDGAAFPVTDGRDLAWSPTWGPGGGNLYFVSDRSGSRDLWVQAIGSDGRPLGKPMEVTTGIGMRNVALSMDGTHLAYSKGRLIAHVWRVPILETGVATWNEAEQMTFDRAYVEFVEVDPQSGSVFVSSNRSGSQDLWRIDDPEERVEHRLTLDEAPDWAPALSPDRTRLAYYSARSGNRDIWVLDLKDGTETQVTRDGGIDFVPSWSPDGRHLAFTSGRSGNLDIWRLDLDDGTVRQLTDAPGADGWPQWSPDGSTIAFRSNRDGVSRLWTLPASGGAPVRVTDMETTYFRWAPDASCLYLISGGQLWRHDLRTGTDRPITALGQKQGAMGIVALALDGSHIYFTWEEDVVDLWMMDRLR